jgi:hypothetical protein
LGDVVESSAMPVPKSPVLPPKYVENDKVAPLEESTET